MCALRRYVLIGVGCGVIFHTVQSFAEPSPSLDENEPSSLRTETLLHPMDGFTGYTLRKNEVIYNQSPFTLPLPSWLWWGVTNWLTVEIDTLPLLGGFFVEPYRPVPSFNFRFRLFKGTGYQPTIAFEAMWQHLWRPFAQEDRDHLLVERDGSTVFGRFNLSQPLTAHLSIHLSAGLTWTESIRIENRARPRFYGAFYENLVSPDLSIALDWRVRPWLSLHASAAYGTTFVYADNQPRKMEVLYGFRVAPFYRSGRSWLRTLRMELPAFIIYHQDAKEVTAFAIPLFPFVYWQWDL